MPGQHDNSEFCRQAAAETHEHVRRNIGQLIDLWRRLLDSDAAELSHLPEDDRLLLLLSLRYAVAISTVAEMDEQLRQLALLN